MYFWKTDALVSELKQGSLSEENFKNYYLATSILTLIGYYLARLELPTNMSAFALEAIGSIGVAIFGLNIIFNANGGNSGSYFLNKTMSISFPLLMKTVIAGLALGVLQALCKIYGVEKDAIEWLNSISIIFIQIVFYWRLSVHIKRVNA